MFTQEEIRISQELDEILNQHERGDIGKGELENKRHELYRELQRWEQSKDDRIGW